MKKTKYFAWMVATGLALTGCSDELDTPGTENNTPIESGTGYVKVSINLPTSSGMATRADDGLANDQFSDGENCEYSVNGTHYIAFFQAPTTTTNPDADATFVKAYQVTLGEGTEINNNVTIKHALITEAPLLENANTYALVILNGHSNVSVTNGILKVGNTTLTTTSKLSDLQGKLSSANGETVFLESTSVTPEGSSTGYAAAKNITMTNAPIAVGQSNTAFANLKITTLAPVTVYENKTTAEGATSDEIYVERIVAKATVSGFTESNGKYTKNVTGNTAYKDDVVEFVAWGLDVKNKSTAFVRDITDATYDDVDDWKTYTTSSGVNRFFSGTNIQEPRRVYWAIDHNYDKMTGDAESIKTEQNAEFKILPDNDDVSLGYKDIDYCLENTFNYDAMDQNQTTRVIFKTKYYFGGNINDPKSFYKIGQDGALYSKENAITQINNLLGDDKIENLGITEGSKGKTYNQTDFTSLFTDNGVAISADQAKLIFSKTGTIRFYKDGDTYYDVALVKHFGDYYTPEPAPSADGKIVYTKDQLGRYGMVRNNWYEINVATISGPGEPEIPEVPTDPTPDDEKEGYINTNINILSWAKRIQNVDL